MCTVTIGNRCTLGAGVTNGAVRWVDGVRELVAWPIGGGRVRPTTVAQLEDASLAWVVRAFEQGNARGVLASAGYDRRDGWRAARLGDTASLVPTLLRFASVDPFARLRPLAYRAGTALQSYQLADGSLGRSAAAAETAAAIDAWCALAVDSNDMSWLEPARAAAAALLSDSPLSALGGMLPVSVAGPLCRLARLAGDARYASAARPLLDRVVGRQRDDAWIDRPPPDETEPQRTRDVVAMCLDLLTGADALEEPVYADAAMRAGSGLLGVYQDMRGLPVQLVASWQPRGPWDPAADAMAATLWLRLAERTASADFRSAAGLVVDRLRRSVWIQPGQPGTSGALRATTSIGPIEASCSHPTRATVSMLDLVADMRWGAGRVAFAQPAMAIDNTAGAFAFAPARSQWTRTLPVPLSLARPA